MFLITLLVCFTTILAWLEWKSWYVKFTTTGATLNIIFYIITSILCACAIVGLVLYCYEVVTRLVVSTQVWYTFIIGPYVVMIAMFFFEVRTIVWLIIQIWLFSLLGLLTVARFPGTETAKEEMLSELEK